MENQNFVDSDEKIATANAQLGTIASIVSHPQDFHQNRVIMRFYLQSIARQLVPDMRVANCLRSIAPGRNTVEIHHAPKTKTAHYKNLLVCGRVWLCPVCAAKISERRAGELLQAVTSWHSDSGFVVLVTYTLSHTKASSLPTLLEALIAAHRTFKMGREWQQLALEHTWRGSIRALEVTHGVNGWHPHLHELVFLEPMASDRFKIFTDAVKTRWVKMIGLQGEFADYAHGADIRETSSDIYDYMAKFGHLPKLTTWTIEREVAKAVVKQASNDGRTPHQLLVDYGNGDTVAGVLWQIYARTFTGRKQLTWSKGLRAMLSLTGDVLSDTKAANEEATIQDTILLATLTREEWRYLINLSIDVRGEILSIASTGDRAALGRYLETFGIA